MSDPIIESGADKWELIYDGRKEVETVVSARYGYTPIPPFEVPILLNSPLIAAASETPNARATWYVGCRVRPKYSFQTEFEVASGPQFVVPLNRLPTLIRFPRWKEEYTLHVEVPYWFLDLRLYIWQYVGNLDSVTDDLVRTQTDVIRVDLARIETKIDQIP